MINQFWVLHVLHEYYILCSDICLYWRIENSNPAEWNLNVLFFILGFELDGVASLEYLLSRPDIDHQKLILYGRSLGGAVAFNVAALEQYTSFLFAVIVENTFTSIPEISKYLFKYLKGLPEWCYKNKVCFISICGSCL